MTKKILLYILITLIAVFGKKYFRTLIIYIDLAYAHINFKLHPLFNYLKLSSHWRETLALTIAPLLVTGAPAIVYKLMKGKLMPHFFEATWLTWFIVVISNILIH